MNVIYCLACILYITMQIYCIFPDNGEFSSKCRIYFASSPNLPSYVSTYCPSVVKKAELVFSAIFRIGHGLNYFLKVMDIIVIAMIAAHSKQLVTLQYIYLMTAWALTIPISGLLSVTLYGIISILGSLDKLLKIHSIDNL